MKKEKKLLKQKKRFRINLKVGDAAAQQELQTKYGG